MEGTWFHDYGVGLVVSVVVLVVAIGLAVSDPKARARRAQKANARRRQRRVERSRQIRRDRAAVYPHLDTKAAARRSHTPRHRGTAIAMVPAEQQWPWGPEDKPPAA